MPTILNARPSEVDTAMLKLHAATSLLHTLRMFQEDSPIDSGPSKDLMCDALAGIGMLLDDAYQSLTSNESEEVTQ